MSNIVKRNIVIGIIFLVVILLGVGYVLYTEFLYLFFLPQEPALKQEKVSVQDVVVLAQGLEIPWEIAFLPNGDVLVTERAGRLLRIGNDRSVYPIEGVRHIGEGGFLGMALHPRFEENGWLYLYFTAETAQGLENRVERYQLKEDALIERTVLLQGIPGSSRHDGGRMEFGPDGMLYITTGDSGKGELSQDINSLAGKILRMKDDGSVPDDNPFQNLVYSYGHRHPQGLTWDEQGNLWSTEHGRSGVQSGFDEINLIVRGKNYGWPVIQGDESVSGMETPVLHSGPDYTWAPAGAEFWDGSIFFGGLRGEALYEAKLLPNREFKLKIHFFGEFGRIRAVRLGPDGMLYLTTSNQDCRGRPREGDDKIIRINPAVFR